MYLIYNVKDHANAEKNVSKAKAGDEAMVGGFPPWSHKS